MEFKLNTNTLRPLSGAGRKLFVETYGCQIKSGVEEGTEVFTQIQSLQAWG